MFEKAHWITYPERQSSVTFVKKFYADKKVKSAKLNITSMGWYHAYINGNRIDTSVFSPGYTEFDKRVQFQSYQIEKNLVQENTLSVELGEGWGGGDHFAWTKPGTFLYFQMSVIFEIVIQYEDNTIEIIDSNGDEDVFTNDIISSTIYGGERRDYRLDAKHLGKSKLIDINTKIIPQEGEEIIEGERISAKKMWKDNQGNLLIDFEQNFAGYVEINIEGKEGDIISYTPCEVLDSNGNFYNKNYRKAESFYSFVLSGKKERIVPRFSFLGGRYIKLVDYPDYIKKENFTAVLVHSSLQRTCEFKCGNDLINKLYKNIIYGQLGNYIDIPTDCPQRDERLGWTADAQVFCSTAAINFNVQKFFYKYIRDLIVTQYEDGALDAVIPKPMKGKLIGSGWSDAATIIPWEIYRAYGDKNILKESVEMMIKWVNYYSSFYRKDYIVSFPFTFGDWLALDKVQTEECRGLTRYDLLDTAFYAYSISILIKTLNELGQDSSPYVELFNHVKESYRNEFICDGHMVGPRATLLCDMERTAYTQTGIVLTLHFNLCNDEEKRSLLEDLKTLIKDCGGKLSTGFLGTPYILFALSDNGETSSAYDLLFQEGIPSWLYSVLHGATTMWEHYDGVREDGSFWFDSMNSFNHYAYGCVFSWIFSHAVGINILQPGYKEVLIKPEIDSRLGYVDCAFESKYGKIEVHWKINKDQVDYLIVVPKDIKATVILNNGKATTLESGGEVRTTIKA